MHRRTFLKHLSAVGAASLLLNCTPSKRSPNVVLILTDDQGWGDLSSNGNSLLNTPNMDRIAAEGARLDRFLVSPVCAPTRASLLTGRHHLRTGVHGVTRGEETMRSQEVTIAEILRQNGYATGCFGKWHNGAHFPNDANGQGFDEFYGFSAGHWNNYFDAPLEHNGQEVKSSGYIADFLTDKALEFVHQNRRRSFFCFIPYNTPHSPFQAPDKYFDKFKAAGLDDELACVYSMCENLDDNIGRLLGRLDELNLAENTIVIFITDNGPNTERFNGEMRGRKASPHEGGSRVSCFIRWTEKITAGSIVKPIAAHYDILPTLVDLLELPQPNTLPLDGVSLAPLLLSHNSNWPDRKIFDYWSPNGSVRTQQHRMIVAPDHIELYDMINDPSETTDIAVKEVEIREDLLAAYDEWWEEVTDNGFEAIPVPLGYKERPEVILPAHEAHLHPDSGAGIRYYGGAGWANDWISGWTDAAAYASWPVVVVRDGNYDIAIDYTCAPENVGVEFAVEIGRGRLTGVIAEAFNPPPNISEDRVVRKEVYEKTWRTLPLGRVRLAKGETELRLKLVNLAGQSAMEVKAVRIEKR